MHEIMGHDLGMAADEVHAAARTVLDFWFNELSDEQHFTKDAELDARIAARFSQLRAALCDHKFDLAAGKRTVGMIICPTACLMGP